MVATLFQLQIAHLTVTCAYVGSEKVPLQFALDSIRLFCHLKIKESCIELLNHYHHNGIVHACNKPFKYYI